MSNSLEPNQKNAGVHRVALDEDEIDVLRSKEEIAKVIERIGFGPGQSIIMLACIMGWLGDGKACKLVLLACNDSTVF